MYKNDTWICAPKWYTVLYFYIVYLREDFFICGDVWEFCVQVKT